MKVAVLGARGMLGTDLMAALEPAHEPLGLDLPECDILAEGVLAAALEPFAPEVVINCAAYTDVDGAETNREFAFKLNADGAGFAAAVGRGLGALLVQISTDYVFDGAQQRPYTEDDATNAISVYGASKLAGEEQVIAAGGAWIIVRTQSLFGLRGKNFIEAIISRAEQVGELDVVADQVSSPTYTPHLAQGLTRLIALPRDRVNRQIVNVANRGACSWFEFARAIVARIRPDTKVRETTAAAFGRPAPRPPHSVLDTGKYEKLTGERMPTWEEALEEYLEARPSRAAFAHEHGRTTQQ